MDVQSYFMKIFNLAEKKYGSSAKRLAGEGWKADWQVLIATIMSAQTRDEVTIPVAKKLFRQYASLQALARAPLVSVRAIIKSVNFSPRKAHYVVNTAKVLVKDYGGKVPDSLDELIKLSGVGRKTANLVLSEIHGKQGITVDTHVHRIANVLGLVRTKTPTQTEFALMQIAPRRYWSRINRLFVLWGKEVPGRNRRRLLDALV
jgi:endonuclease-3